MVKWFVEEEGAAAAERLRAEATSAVSRLTEVELVSAFARRQREGGISPRELDVLLARATEELASTVVVELTGTVLERARDLLLRHPLRTADAIQLAACLELRERLGEPVRFACFDQRLTDAARRERLAVSLE